MKFVCLATALKRDTCNILQYIAAKYAKGHFLFSDFIKLRTKLGHDVWKIAVNGVSIIKPITQKIFKVISIYFPSQRSFYAIMIGNVRCFVFHRA